MKTYEDGLNEAWEVARKIACTAEKGGYTWTVLEQIFNTRSLSDIIDTYTASEAIDAMENYERIKVGDEVKGHTTVGIVLECWYNDEMTIMWANGSVTIGHKSRDLTKTGRHFPQIEEVLKQMQEGNE